jgi:gas vesicle protein
MKLSIDELPPLPKMNGDGKKSDTRDWLKNLLSVFEGVEAPALPLPVVPPLPIVPPPLPLLPPVLPLAPWGWSGKKNRNKDDRKDQWNQVKNDAETRRETMRGAQKASVDAWNDQWDKAFPKLMEILESFAASLPDEAPTLFGMPIFGVSPRGFMEKMNEFTENAGKHAREQADSFNDFVRKGQQQAKEVITKTVERIENDTEDILDDAE